MRLSAIAAILICVTCLGCGTSQWTDTKRSATEQLLISDAMDRAVSELDFRALAGQEVYLDALAIKAMTDAPYLVSTLRQHLLASGCILRDERDEAEYIVEARAGAIGTDRHDVLWGVPAVNIPTIVPIAGYGIPSSIPEIPFIKRTDQKAVTKIAVFAYNQKTGRPVWQSGVIPIESDATARWVLGAGPFQSGSIYKGTEFAGQESVLGLDLAPSDFAADGKLRDLNVTNEAFFPEPPEIAADAKPAKKKAPQTATKPSNKATAKTAPATKPGAAVAQAITSSPPKPSGKAVQPATSLTPLPAPPFVGPPTTPRPTPPIHGPQPGQPVSYQAPYPSTGSPTPQPPVTPAYTAPLPNQSRAGTPPPVDPWAAPTTSGQASYATQPNLALAQPYGSSWSGDDPRFTAPLNTSRDVAFVHSLELMVPPTAMRPVETPAPNTAPAAPEPMASWPPERPQWLQ